MFNKYSLSYNTRVSYINCINDWGPLLSIKNNKQLENCQRIVKELTSIKRDTGQDEYLNCLKDLITYYLRNS